MRTFYSIIFLIIAVALGVCAVIAHGSKRPVGKSVSMLLLSLMPPVVGNLIIIFSEQQLLSTIGYYIYFLGMDLLMFSLLRFTWKYCALPASRRKLAWIANVFLLLDVIQYAVNPFLKQAFTTVCIQVDEADYYSFTPYIGQTFHRFVDYGIFAVALIIFLVKLVRSPKIYAERYLVIFLSMVVGVVWESYYIFSGNPIDRSMLCFGVFGLLVFYFSIFYRPRRLLDRMLANIASGMSEAYYFFDMNGHCIWSNPVGMELVHIGEDEFDKASDVLQSMFGKLDWTKEWNDQFVTNDGAESHYFYVGNHLVTDNKQRTTGSFLSVRDNTQEQATLQKEKYIATHDLLTDMYSRDYLYQQIHEHLTAHQETPHYIVFLDVNDFKIVNDVYGNAYGDYVLQTIADQIRQEVTEDCVYGRLGGDTFGICIPVSEFHEDRLERELSQSIVDNGTVKYHILIHLGVYLVKDPDTDVSVMFDRARMALATVKENYQQHIAYFDHDMRDQVLWNQTISTQLPTAIAEGQIKPYLQPMVDLHSNIVGAEVLVRWEHPEYGFLGPGRFIPVFEHNGMISEVDLHMWRSACAILKDWEKEGKDLFLSVNISPNDFHYMDVAKEIKAIVAEYQIEPSRLRLEITETVMMSDIKHRLGVIMELKEAGFIVEMDDFGSGYSSLNMLKDIPVDVLKIDMKFLEQAENSQKAQTIVHNIINMTEGLGIAALTEGVETQPQYQMLSEMGCKLFQGYYFSRPVPRETFESLCSSRLDPKS